MMFQYWNETLENIIKDQRNDKFKIIVNDLIYEVPLSYALAISSIITEQYLKDSTLNKFNIKINTKENKKINGQKIQEEFSKFIKGEKISSEIFYKIGIHLQNKEMIKEWSKKQELTKETVMTIIKANHELYNNRKDKDLAIKNIEEELEFIGEHIEEMKEEIQELTEEELLFILSNDKMKIEKEDLIWEIIKERIENKYQNNSDDKQKMENQNNKSILMGTIEAKYLKKKYFIEYIDKIEEEDIEREPKIFKNLKEILIMNIKQLSLGENIEKLNDTDQVKDKGLEIIHKSENNFDGIIKYLENKYGENIIQQGIISIEVSSNSYSGNSTYGFHENLINYNWVNGFFSKNVPNSWFEVNFKNNKVKINGYSLKTSRNSYSHLKSWVIEGSNDRSNWTEIDKKENNYDLNGPSYQKYFPISQITDEFQFIRIRTIGKDHYNEDYLVLTNFEFYGEIFIKE